MDVGQVVLEIVKLLVAMNVQILALKPAVMIAQKIVMKIVEEEHALRIVCHNVQYIVQIIVVQFVIVVAVVPIHVLDVETLVQALVLEVVVVIVLVLVEQLVLQLVHLHLMHINI